MRIIYFTTCLENSQFDSFSKIWKIALNPSNQNFHNKIVRSLAITNKVDVFSIRPFSLHNTTEKKLKKFVQEDGNITWHYLKINHFKHLRYISALEEASLIFPKIKDKDSIIITDTINPRPLKMALHFGKKYKIPVIGLCTDSPSNIAGTRRSYSLKLLSIAQNMNGIIALTNELGELYGSENKPSVVIEGIVDDDKIKTFENDYGKFFYFGGALSSRYGIYELINAYKKLDTNDVKLIIAGHHYEKDKFFPAIKDCKGIQFIGSVPYELNRFLENKSIACINPRPNTEDLERYSIPSKVLEFASSRALIISTPNKNLYKYLKDSIIWTNQDSTSIYKSLQKALSLSDKEKEEMTAKSYLKINKEFSLESINKKIVNFLESFK